MSRGLGSFRHCILAAPAYLARHGTPQVPDDLMAHACLHHRHPATGKPESWPLWRDGADLDIDLPVSAIAGTAQARAFLAAEGLGIACVPPFVARQYLTDRRLVEVLAPFVRPVGRFHLLWPTGRHLSPRIRAFVDHMVTGFDILVG